jgi:hypothetical protein
MNWDTIGAIGEIVAAIAVVATLLYLSKQIRQNSRSVEISALRDTTAQWNHWSEMLATSADLADVVAKGNNSYGSLSESESLRYGAFVQAFFDNVESYRELVSKHQVDKDLAVLESIVARRIEASGFSVWWSENTKDYGDDFVSWIENIQLGT